MEEKNSLIPKFLNNSVTIIVKCSNSFEWNSSKTMEGEVQGETQEFSSGCNNLEMPHRNPYTDGYVSQ